MEAEEMNPQATATTESTEPSPHSSETVPGTGMSRPLRRSSVFTAGKKIAQQLQRELADPSRWAQLKSSKSNIRISQFNLACLARLESETGLRSHNETLTYLIETGRSENMVLPANLKLLLHADQPVCLCGPSGSGKSLTLKRYLPDIPGPLFVIDLADEHTGLKRISIGDFFEVKWAKTNIETRLKFVPSSALDIGSAELKMLFDRLSMVKSEGHVPTKFPSGILSNLVLVVEEAHRLSTERSFLNFLAEGRKYLRKIILVASDPTLYGSICRLVRPPNLDTLLPEDKRRNVLEAESETT